MSLQVSCRIVSIGVTPICGEICTTEYFLQVGLKFSALPQETAAVVDIVDPVGMNDDCVQARVRLWMLQCRWHIHAHRAEGSTGA